MPRKTLVIIGWAALALFRPDPAGATVDVCVDIRADGEDLPGLTKLVLSEMARHPSHAAAEKDCETTLMVEMFKVGKKRYVTIRLGKEIPVRFEVQNDGALDDGLKESLTLVLSNDPVMLTKNIETYSRMQRATHSVLKKGHNIWRAEVFETMARGEGKLVFASGAAFAVTRGADHLFVLARLYFAGWPGRNRLNESFLRLSAGIDLGITYEVSTLSNATFYLTGGLGLQYLRYEKRMTNSGHTDVESIDEIIPSPFLRAGGRFLRYCDFDLDLFISGYLPFYKVNDPDAPIFGDKGLYTPSFQIGMGVGF